MRFGLYLVRRGLVKPADLVAALEKQQRELPRLGQIAIEEGMLSVREVFQVLHHLGPLAEERFGERAIELGLLKRQEVAELLLIQSERCRPVSEILVERGALTRDQEREAREAHQEEQHLSGKPRAGDADTGQVQSDESKLLTIPPDSN